jgi:hypothetical protein
VYGFAEVIFGAGIVERVVRNVTVVLLFVLRRVGPGNELPILDDVNVGFQPIDAHLHCLFVFVIDYKFITFSNPTLLI